MADKEVLDLLSKIQKDIALLKKKLQPKQEPICNLCSAREGNKVIPIYRKIGEIYYQEDIYGICPCSMKTDWSKK